MKKRWKVGIVLVAIFILPVLTYLVFGGLAIFTLEAKYETLRDGMTIEETDRFMGFLFRGQMMDWDDIPKIYTGHYVQRASSVVRSYRFLGVGALSIVVVYDEKGFSYLHIPIYE
jgi:hypothetical protein